MTAVAYFFIGPREQKSVELIGDGQQIMPSVP
jgi:hypothetical protein